MDSCAAQKVTGLLSDDYVEQLIKLHSHQSWGASGYSHAVTVAKYRRTIGAKTVLDYGCGRATLKKALLACDPTIKPDWITEYDPAIKGKDKIPDAADLLVANDVLEHIEREFLGETLDRLRSLARLGAYFTIALTPSKISLPDGRNAHLIIEPRQWWLQKLVAAGFRIKRTELRKGLWVWAR